MTANSFSSPRVQILPYGHQHQSLFLAGLLLALIGILFAACSPAQPSPAQPSDPISIVKAAYDRLNQYDIDGYMKLLSDDVVMIDGSGRFDGPQAIRDNLALNVMPEHMTFEISDLSRDGNIVTYTIKISASGHLVDSFDDGITIVKDGKITFDGRERYRDIECNLDPSQAFCSGN